MSQRLALLYNAQSMLGIPLIADERKIGAALVAYEKHHEFTTNEISICKQASGQLALAIAKARLFETEQHRAEQLTLINQISLDLASDLELDPLLRSLYAHLKKIVPVDMFYIALHDPTARQFYLPAYAQDDIYISHDQSEALPRCSAHAGLNRALSKTEKRSIFQTWKMNMLVCLPSCPLGSRTGVI
jgi:GAF domain-containing protein